MKKEFKFNDIEDAESFINSLSTNNNEDFAGLPEDYLITISFEYIPRYYDND